MEKLTTEYAKKLSIINVRGSFQQNAYIMGYMKAIEETAAPDMLEALIKCSNINKTAREHISDDLFEMINNAINKATK